MKSKLINEGSEKTFVLIFDKGDEVTTELLQFAVDGRLLASHFTAIGALSEAVLGFFDTTKKDYKKIAMREQLEVLSLDGDIVLQDGKPKIHAHIVVGKSDGTAHGGHLLQGRVFPTLELILIESPKYLQRRIDQETGLALIDLEAA